MKRMKEIVLPGDEVRVDKLKPRQGVRKVGGTYISTYLGVLQKSDEYIDVIPFTSPYIPRKGDRVIGKVIDVGPSMWILDINSPYTTLLHMNDSPWRVNSGDLKKFLYPGEWVYAKIMSVNGIKESWITLKDVGLRKLDGGAIITMPYTKVPRIIGKKGNMINMIKDTLHTRIIVGQNGLIWLDGSPENVEIAIDTLELIQKLAHGEGLTDYIKEYLEKRRGDIVGNSK